MLTPRDPNLSVRLALANGDDTPVEVLEQLAVDAEAQVRLAVASNPNTPEELLLKLSEEFPDAIIENPIFNILRLEKLESQLIRLCLARSLTTPAETLAILAQIPDEDILCAVADNPNTSAAILEQLVDDPSEFWEYRDGLELDRLFSRIAKNPNTPISALTELAKNISSSQCHALASDPNTHPAILDTLANWQDLDWQGDFTQHPLLSNPNTPATALEKLAGEKAENVRRRVKAHPNASEKVIAVVDFVDGKSDSPVHLLEQFASHSRPFVRCLVAADLRTPPLVLEMLSQDADINVLLNVAKHPEATGIALENIAKRLVIEHEHRYYYQPGFITIIAKSTLKHPNITIATLNALSGIVDPVTYIAVSQALSASTQPSPDTSQPD